VSEVAGNYRTPSNSIVTVFGHIVAGGPVGKKLVVVQNFLLDMVAKLGFQRGLARYKIR
jgi:hypothetical protein